MSISKEKIKKDIVDQLYWDSRVDAAKIQVKVKDGEIILKGEAPNYNAKSSASTDAWSIEGVRAVKNEIEVKYPVSIEVPTDDEIATNIRTLLTLNKKY